MTKSLEDRIKENNPVVCNNYTLEDYYLAMSGKGPLASEWADKPHRLVYDLIYMIVIQQEDSDTIFKLME